MGEKVYFGTDEEKSKAALCRMIAGCEGSFFFPCETCGQYINIFLARSEYKVTTADQVFIRHEAIERETLQNFGILVPQQGSA